MGTNATRVRAGASSLAGALAAVALAGAVVVGLVVVAAPGVAGASHVKVVKVGTADVAHVGDVLTTGSGLTLYHFTGNPPGKSMCTGGCATVWPPFMAPKGARISGPKGVKGLSLVSTGHGHWQVALDKALLYRFEGDTKKGQAKGQGVLGKWFAAPKSGITAAAAGPAVTVPTSTTTTAPTTTTSPLPTTTPPTSQPAPTMPPTPATAPAPAPAPAPTTTTAPLATTTTAPPTTTTTSGGGGYGY